MQTLAEAKAEVAAQEAKEAEALKNQDTLAGDDTVAGSGDDTLKGNDTTAGADLDNDDTLAGDPDDWMKPDGEDTTTAGDHVDNATAKAIRLKYQSQTRAAKDEAEQLRQENEDLKRRLNAPSSQANLPEKPDPAKYATDAEFQDALLDWKLAVRDHNAQAQQLADQRKRQMAAKAAEIESGIESHYVRAAALAEQTKSLPEDRRITAERFQAADLSLRQAISSVYPQGADIITDALIANLGPGSEKVAYSLGVNKVKQKELIDLLKSDPSGIKASVFLGKMVAQVNAVAARSTSTPEPAETIRGDKSNGGMAQKLKKDYQRAVDHDDPQKQLEIRKKARAANIDISNW